MRFGHCPHCGESVASRRRVAFLLLFIWKYVLRFGWGVVIFALGAGFMSLIGLMVGIVIDLIIGNHVDRLAGIISVVAGLTGGTASACVWTVMHPFIILRGIIARSRSVYPMPTSELRKEAALWIWIYNEYAFCRATCWEDSRHHLRNGYWTQRGFLDRDQDLIGPPGLMVYPGMPRGPAPVPVPGPEEQPPAGPTTGPRTAMPVTDVPTTWREE